MILVFIFFTDVTAGQAADLDLNRSSENEIQDTWHITADKIEYVQKFDQYIAEGDVVITGKDQKINAEYVRYDRKNKKAYALGNVVMMAGDDVVHGDRMTLDLEKRTGTAYQGMVFIREGNYRLWGDKIQKTGENTYFAENAIITTCDGDQTDWKVSGNEAEVTIEGYGKVNHATLWAKDMPVLYSPLLFFPAKRKRQSGFLAPRFSFSDRLGAEYDQPYYWAINDQTDATFYLDHMEERGEKISAEYRYVVRHGSQGAAFLDYLKDDKIDIGTEESSTRWGYDEDDDIIRPNEKRYWFRMKSTQMLPYELTGKLDLDVVSDQDYLTEFRDGYSGFDETADYFEKNYGRGLDDYTDATRINTLIVGKSWEQYSLNVEGRWEDDLLKRNGKILVKGTPATEEQPATEDSIQNYSDTDNTVQKLPSIQLNGLKQEAWDQSWLYWSIDTQTDFFYRIDGVRGDRADLYPRFYVPMRYRNYVSFEPSLGLRETLWYVTDYNGGMESSYDEEILENRLSREIYDIQLDLSTEVFRIYKPGWKRIERFRHAVIPQVLYEYRPSWDESEYPVFDSIDHLGGAHRITYSLENTLTSREMVSNGPVQNRVLLRNRAKDKDQDVNLNQNENEVTEYSYEQFCRFELSQSYDINQRNVINPEPFSAITGDLEFSLWRYFSLNTDAAWNPYVNRLTERNIGVWFSDDRGDEFSIEYRRSSGETESLNTYSYLVLTERFSLYFELARDLLEKKYIETRASVLYKTGCWSADLGITKTQEDRKYSLMINLYGLGGFGRSIRPIDEE